MAFSMAQAQPWHLGEDKMHELTKVPNRDNPTSPFLTPRAANQIQRFPLIAVGTLDSRSRPWCTIWGGETPFAQPVGPSIIGIRTIVDSSYDPVIEAIFQGKDDGEVVKEQGRGRMISGLSIHLEERNRVKLFGRMVAGALGAMEEQEEGQSQPKAKKGETKGNVGQVQLVVRIEQSLGNCPKYLNSKRIAPAIPSPELISDSIHLPPQAITLLEKADTFFISSSDHDNDMDMNIRGGPRGFVRMASNASPNATSGVETETVLVWPEYSGNNLYQTLGNLISTPQAGLCIPDFETGDALYLTGTAEVLVGSDANQLLPHSNLAVRLQVTGARFVQSGLPFRGTELETANGGASPYNPRVRFLKSEKPDTLGDNQENTVTAKLIKLEKLTPTVNRYRFALSDPMSFGLWKPGQYVALSFHDELYMGYEHMRDDDPTSLNDDFLRTFTVSSRHGMGIHGEEFEATIRNVGAVTGWLSGQRVGRGMTVEVQVKGFGGDFVMEQKDGKGLTPFIAAGIGITPLLPQIKDLDLGRLKLVWSVSVRDVGLVVDTFEKYPDLAAVTELFLSGDQSQLGEKTQEKIDRVKVVAGRCEMRRLQKDDLAKFAGEVQEWYLCTSPAFRKIVQEWLPGQQIIFENFDY